MMTKRTYDECGNPMVSTKGTLGCECGMLICTMSDARWFHNERDTYVCEWCAKDANRAVSGMAVIHPVEPDVVDLSDVLSPF